MTKFEMVITEALEPERDSTKLTRVARLVFWRGLAAGQNDPTAKLSELWDDRYRTEARPARALRNVTALAPS
jgi:hypothetical protein